MKEKSAAKRKESLGSWLRRQGFDLTTYNRATGGYRPRCSSCEALVIQGIACHEIGCPNERKAREED